MKFAMMVLIIIVTVRLMNHVQWLVEKAVLDDYLVSDLVSVLLLKNVSMLHEYHAGLCRLEKDVPIVLDDVLPQMSLLNSDRCMIVYIYRLNM